ncbi:MAG: PHP domain-containing protein [Pseudomonadota bacterium]
MSLPELAATTNFTFLTGASHPEEMVERAAELGLSAIAICDRNSVAGVVRAHVRLREMRRQKTGKKARNITGSDVREHARIRSQVRVDPSSRLTETKVQERFSQKTILPEPEPETYETLPNLIIGARLQLTDSPIDFIALCPDRPAYARLCRLLTDGKQRAEKGSCDLRLDDLATNANGLILIADPPDPLAAQTDKTTQKPGGRSASPDWPTLTRRLEGLEGLALVPRYDGRDTERFWQLSEIAEKNNLKPIALTAPMMHRGNRRQLADVLTCIREGCSVDDLGHRALPNAEQHLRAPQELMRIYADHPQALTNAQEIAARCTFSLDELAYEYPDEGRGESPQDRLTRLAQEGLNWRYPDGIPQRSQDLVNREIALIGKLNYAPYFLTVHDIVAFARSRGILCQGRGSAANSTVCYALGITEIAPDTISMVFERFVSEARDEPPDIDVDFEHERREEVIQHIYDRYGRERAGLTATVIHFRSRAAIREVGKAMGLSVDVTAALAGQVWGWSREAIADSRLREIGLDPTDPRLQRTLALVEQIIGFPRHLSQHVGGFVITAGRLDELCPIENAAMEDRTVIEWDKDDIDALGILKVDVLALGMLTCVRKAFDLLSQHTGTDYTLATLPPECPEVYDMLCAADSVGVFQVESRAQMNFLPRMRPRNFYDLVIEVAIIRPGPIQGDMVHPYIRRRNGEGK